MIDTSDFRNGTIFEHEGAVYEVVWFQHHKPGKGGAVMRVKIKNLSTGAIIERTFKSGEKFKDVSLSKKKKQFLYTDNDTYHFMDMDTYEEITVSEKDLGEIVKYLPENAEVSAVYLDDKLLTVELPPSVSLKVTSTVPGIKGDSVSNLMKPATLEGGLELQVPLFIKEGDVIKVDTRSGQYLERVTS